MIIALSFLAAVLILLVVNAVACTTDKLQDKTVIVTKGKHEGRKGKVISVPWIINGWHRWRVTLNVEANEDEKRQMIAKKIANGWRMPHEATHIGEDAVASVEDARTWIKVPTRYIKVPCPHCGGVIQ